jgi:hypothetical protein
MSNTLRIGSWSPLSALVALNGAFIVIYLGLIATAMTYAALEVQFTQFTKNDEAAVATLEASYLASTASLTSVNYTALGYANPVAEIVVPGAPQTAINFH